MKGCESAARIEELRREAHKFLDILTHVSPDPSPSGAGDQGEAANSSAELATNVSFQDPPPLLTDSAPVLASELSDERRVDKPGTDHHWHIRDASGREAMPPAQATTSSSPRGSSKRFAPQPQASIFAIRGPQKRKTELSKQPSPVKPHDWTSYSSNKQPPAENPRYRTSYGDANAWIHSDAALQTAADDLKARQVLDAATWPGTNCEHRYVLTAATALCVAKESAREFLGENLHVNPVKSGAPLIGVSSAAPARASSAAQSADAAHVQIARDEAIQTELEPIARVLQPPKVESSRQTDPVVSVFPAVAVMPVASNRTTRKASAIRKALNRPSVPLVHERSTVKTRLVHEKPKTTGVKISTHLQSTANPLLMYPRYPPEPMIFRAKSTYMTEFGKVGVKKRISAR